MPTQVILKRDAASSFIYTTTTNLENDATHIIQTFK